MKAEYFFGEFKMIQFVLCQDFSTSALWRDSSLLWEAVLCVGVVGCVTASLASVH